LTGVIVLAIVYAIALALLLGRIVAMAFYGNLPTLDFTATTINEPSKLNQVAAFVYGTTLVTLRAYGYILLTTARVQTRLRQTATIDDLTGLPNRRAFEEEMRRIAPRVRRDGISFGLAVMDIDHFKKINDTYGHAVGDAMLRHFADAVSGVLRDTDFFARTGGEEFVLVAADTSATALRQAAERIRHALEQAPLNLPSGPLHATLSAGIAVSQPEEIDYQAVYSRADQALYRAKAGGRNRIESA
jgi:diguanylate cyclase (GGDEF)-like protein